MGVRYCIENPLVYGQTNVISSTFSNWRKNLSRRSHDRLQLVCVWKCATIRVREEDATDQPISLYGATKKVLKWSRIPIIISTTSWSVCVLLSMSVNDQIWPASFHTTHFERPADWCVWSCMARFYLHWWYCRWNLCGGKNLHGKSRILPRKLNTPRSLSRVETACGKQAIKTISYATGRCQTDIRGQCNVQKHPDWTPQTTLKEGRIVVEWYRWHYNVWSSLATTYHWRPGKTRNVYARSSFLSSTRR